MTKQPIQILHRIIFSETKFDDSIVSFHGAAVEHNKKAYVFLASSKAGKSTLVSFLTYHGLKYIADDRVFVNRNNKMVQPVIIPIHLRQNGFDILKSFGESPKEYTIVGEGESKRIVFTPTNFSVDPLPIQAIMFIKRENKNSFEKIEKSNSFDSLLKSSSCVNQIDIDYVRFVNFLSTFSAFDLIYKDLFFVLDCIYKL
ncbi:MAG: hypothetical protein IJQ47_00270 [Synergistaceae bacterium]|nr:hypothetical protein [Synergistaceae bacterium]